MCELTADIKFLEEILEKVDSLSLLDQDEGIQMLKDQISHMQKRLPQDGVVKPPEINEELRLFVKDITLFLQKHSNYNPKKIEPMFQRAYRLYVKYDVEKRIED